MDELELSKVLRGKHCKKCGKEFFPTPEHVYKDHNGAYCSWSCFSHRNDRKPRERKQVEQYNLDKVLIRTFANADEAAEKIKGTAGGLREACIKASHSEDQLYLYKKYYWRYKP